MNMNMNMNDEMAMNSDMDSDADPDAHVDPDANAMDASNERTVQRTGLPYTPTLGLPTLVHACMTVWYNNATPLHDEYVNDSIDRSTIPCSIINLIMHHGGGDDDELDTSSVMSLVALGSMDAVDNATDIVTCDDEAPEQQPWVRLFPMIQGSWSNSLLYSQVCNPVHYDDLLFRMNLRTEHHLRAREGGLLVEACTMNVLLEQDPHDRSLWASSIQMPIAVPSNDNDTIYVELVYTSVGWDKDLADTIEQLYATTPPRAHHEEDNVSVRRNIDLIIPQLRCVYRDVSSLKGREPLFVSTNEMGQHQLSRVQTCGLITVSTNGIEVTSGMERPRTYIRDDPPMTDRRNPTLDDGDNDCHHDDEEDDDGDDEDGDVFDMRPTLGRTTFMLTAYDDSGNPRRYPFFEI